MSLFTITFESSGEYSDDEPAQEPTNQKSPVRSSPGGGKTAPGAIVFSDSYSDDDDIPTITKMEPRVPQKPQPEEEEYTSEYEYSEEGVKPICPPSSPKVAVTVEAAEEEEQEIHKLPLASDVPATLKRFSIMRFKKGLRGRLSFMLSKDDKSVLVAKVRDRESIVIGLPADKNEKTITQVASVTISEKGKLFQLKDNEGSCVMSMRFSLPNGPRTPRKVDVELHNSPVPELTKMTNRTPHCIRNSVWVVDLGGRYAMKSRKNCVVVDSDNKEILVAIKAHKHRMTVEVLKELDDTYAFAFGLACFLCKV